MSICSIHQPNFVPYLGYFDKYLRSDIFVLYDTALFSRRGFHNRNRIKTPQGPLWLTIPVHVHRGQAIREAMVSDRSFMTTHLRTLKHCYGRARHFEAVFASLHDAYLSNDSPRLVDVNRRIVEAIFALLGGSARVVLASDLGIDSSMRSSEALAEIVSRVGGGTYLSGSGGRDYLDESVFARRGLDVAWQEFRSEHYPQLWDGFTPNLSVLDALFNLGAEGVLELLAVSC